MSATEFTNTTKAYDRNRPIHRINSPSYDEARPQISGHGHDCGCRGPADFLGTSFPGPDLSRKLGVRSILEVMRTIPDWVPVEREGKPPDITPQQWKTLPEIEYELEGAVKESRFAGSDVPFAQWHLWYDWNFFIVPDKGYEYLRGKGNLHDYMEIEWDAGAFGDYDFQGKLPTPDAPGPMFGQDWAWPVSGEHMWVSGRWIYDCGHPNSGILVDDGSKDGKLLVGDITEPEVRDGKLNLDNVDSVTIRTRNGDEVASKNNIKNVDVEALVQSELHPCKAMAVGRWEAVLFKENAQPVPAIQFMFFACSDGGYISPFKLNDRDYEFIVDLPEIEEDDSPYPIGHTPDFAINTIVLRPRLLVKFDYAPFTTAHQPAASPGQADPQIELLPVEKGGVPKQVKLRMPMTQLTATTHSYGVIVSLGWHDPKRTQSQKVKKVTVVLDSLEVGKAASEFETEHHKDQKDWQMKVGVNGRWFAATAKVSAGMTIPLGHTVELNLAENDQIAIAAHGITPRTVARFFARAIDQRTMRFNSTTPVGVIDDDRGPTPGSRTIFAPGNPLVWGDDIDQPDPHHASDVAEIIVDESRNNVLWGQGNVTDENEGREQINPAALNRVRDFDTPNPLTMEQLKQLTAPGTSLACQLTAASEIIGEPDYILHYQITYDDLPNYP